MLSIILPSLYFVALFGFFEAFMFRRGIAYWQKPITTTAYFFIATIVALILFSSDPISMLLDSSIVSVFAVLGLYTALCVLAYRQWFTADGESINSNVGPRAESFRYVLAKSADILFQDTLAIIVLLALYTFLGDISLTFIIFSIYFFIAHLALLLLLPPKFALIFAFGSVLAAPAFAAIVLFEFGILYVFVLHWVFYAVMYSLIKTVRKNTNLMKRPV